MKNKIKTKYIFVTGGVLSGIGKGVSAASLGSLLKARGFTVFVQKFDPYYNVDPGTMSPYQHGEVFVTADGGETDLDLGHYERFIGESFKKESNYTQGKLLQELLDEERLGIYGGSTIQMVPHVTNKIIKKIEEAVKKYKPNFVITEIGGTVGDIESEPFMYALAQYSRKNQGDCFFIHAVYLPYLKASKEFKTKPIQQSLSIAKSLGIRPDMLLVRSEYQIDDSTIRKISKKTFVDLKGCIPVPDVDNIYKIPLHFEKMGAAKYILRKLELPNKRANLTNYKNFLNLLDTPKSKKVKIGMVGKYIEFEDAYKSIIEALKISATYANVDLELKWIQSEDLNNRNIKNKLKGLNGIVILPGFGQRGFHGKVVAVAYTRKHDIPTFGICYGFQAMVIHQSHLKGIKDASSTEVDADCTPVIDIINPNNKKLGGTLRLGETETIHKDNSLLKQYYNADSSFERHRHRYEVNPKYVDEIEDEEFVFSGFDKKTGLVEVCEMKSKKFYIGLQAHPEFNARPLKEHPLFKEFMSAVKKN